MKEEKINLLLPVDYWEEDGRHGISVNEETDKLLGMNLAIVVEEESKEKAEVMFWNLMKWEFEYLQERSEELDRWKPFQKGNWGNIGGKWVIFFGLNFYFRYGKGMRGGKYIPFTKLNISFYNHWKRKKK